MTEGKSDSTCESILIVEDDDAIREVLREILELEGYRVFTAANGKIGLEVLETIPRPCLILLDFMMPVMDGIEFAHAMMQDDLLAPTPIVVISAFGDRAKEIRSAGFIKKPIDFEILLGLVKKYCGAPPK